MIVKVMSRMEMIGAGVRMADRERGREREKKGNARWKSETKRLKQVS